MNRFLSVSALFLILLLGACQSSSSDSEQQEGIVNEEIPIEDVEKAMEKMSQELEEIEDEKQTEQDSIPKK